MPSSPDNARNIEALAGEIRELRELVEKFGRIQISNGVRYSQIEARIVELEQKPKPTIKSPYPAEEPPNLSAPPETPVVGYPELVDAPVNPSPPLSEPPVHLQDFPEPESTEPPPPETGDQD